MVRQGPGQLLVLRCSLANGAPRLGCGRRLLGQLRAGGLLIIQAASWRQRGCQLSIYNRRGLRAPAWRQQGIPKRVAGAALPIILGSAQVPCAQVPLLLLLLMLMLMLMLRRRRLLRPDCCRLASIASATALLAGVAGGPASLGHLPILLQMALHVKEGQARHVHRQLDALWSGLERAACKVAQQCSRAAQWMGRSGQAGGRMAVQRRREGVGSSMQRGACTRQVLERTCSLPTQRAKCGPPAGARLLVLVRPRRAHLTAARPPQTVHAARVTSGGVCASGGCSLRIPGARTDRAVSGTRVGAAVGNRHAVLAACPAVGNPTECHWCSSTSMTSCMNQPHLPSCCCLCCICDSSRGAGILSACAAASATRCDCAGWAAATERAPRLGAAAPVHAAPCIGIK